MTESGFFQQQKRASPTGLAIVILLHGAALTALAMSKTTFELPAKPPPTEIIFVPLKPPPPPEPLAKAEPLPQPKSEFTYRPPIVDIPRPPVGYRATEMIVPPRPADLPGPALPPEPVFEARLAPRADPVRTGAEMDSRSVLQPPYPASEQQSGAEGLVSVRVLIGPDGRVRSVEKLRATSDAFYRATERHALRSWRFRPATVDGRPVESRKTFNLKFELDG